MDFFDERVLAVNRSRCRCRVLWLKPTSPKSVVKLLGLPSLSAAKGLVVREKVVANGFGRPRFAYHIPSRTTKQVTAALEDPTVEPVAIPFSRLRHVCRFEKGGYCKETKRNCAPQICPQIRK